MSDPFQPASPDSPTPNPAASARQPARPPLPKRFYAQAGVTERDGRYALVLDGRPARTPARSLLAAPTRALAEAVAEEWQTQEGVIDPARMPLTRLLNSAVDGVAPRLDEVRDDLVRYAGSDLICYRAGEPDRLVRAQGEAWDPVLAWAREAIGARFILSQGVSFVEQPDPALSAVRAAVAREPSAEAVAALHVMTTLTGSVLLALAVARRAVSAEQAWEAAHVDERFQEQAWGEDAEALERRDKRRVEFMAAARFHALSRA